jgi:hypothetical protein
MKSKTYVVTNPGLCHFSHGQQMSHSTYEFMKQVYGEDTFEVTEYNRELQKKLISENKYVYIYSEQELKDVAYEIIENTQEWFDSKEYIEFLTT